MEMREYIEAIAESCRKLIISKPATKQEEYRKIIVQKKEAFFQMEKYTDKQVFHENLSVEELETALEELMQNHFRQLNGFDTEAEHILLVSKKGVPSYKKKKLYAKKTVYGIAKTVKVNKFTPSSRTISGYTRPSYKVQVTVNGKTYTKKANIGT